MFVAVLTLKMLSAEAQHQYLILRAGILRAECESINYLILYVFLPDPNDVPNIFALLLLDSF